MARKLETDVALIHQVDWSKSAITDKLVEETSEGTREEVRAKIMQEVAKYRKVMNDTTWETCEISGEEDATRHPKSLADEVLANDECGRCVSSSQSTTAKEASPARRQHSQTMWT